MKKNPLPAAMPVLFLFVFFMCFAQGNAAAPESITAAKPLPSREVQTPQAVPLKLPLSVVAPSSLPLNRNAVGCAFPLTGRFADAGNRALDAVLLSAELFNQRSPSPWKIIVADSGDTSAKTKEAITYLADTANVMAIIAISGTAEATEAAREAQKRKVPLILIASKEGVTDTGDYVFQHFLTPAQQVESIAKYAQNTLNIGFFSILYPQDDYGEEMLRLFRREVQKIGGKVMKAIPYSITQTDFTEQIQKLIGNKVGKPDKAHVSAENTQSWLSLDFEALFIPDSPPRVKMIASQLAYYDVRGMKLLGTSLWHLPDLLKKEGEYLEGAVFADSFFVNGFLPETNDFVDAYYSAYSREPGNIDALSYDTMEMVLGILEDRQTKTRVDFLLALLAVERFRGATGRISFGGARVSQKDAFILRIQNGKVEQVR